MHSAVHLLDHLSLGRSGWRDLQSLACVTPLLHSVATSRAYWEHRFALDGLTLMRSCSSVRDYLCEHSRCQRIAGKVNRRQARVQLVAFVSRLADFVLPETESDMALLEDEACAAVLEGDQQWGLSMQLTWDDRILLRFYYFLSGGCTWNDYNAEPRVYDYALSSKSAALLHYRLLYHNYLLVERPVYWQPSKREPI
jgi:hypothetical protein